MKKLKKIIKHKYFLPLFIFTLSLALRLINLEGLTTFDWDQARDIQTLSSIVQNKKPTLIGPIVKGDGGFFLGPLYYYLVLPFFLIFQADPISLSFFSVLTDSLLFLFLYFFLNKTFNKKIATLGSFFWAISWFNIQASHIPWNVTLLQPWMLAFIWVTKIPSSKPTQHKKLIFFFLLSLSFHIHLSLIPIAIATFFVSLKPIFKKLKPKNILSISLSFFLPFLPLLAFDLRHSFTNSKLIFQFFQTQKPSFTLKEFLPIIQDKLGYTITRFFFNSTLPKIGFIIFLTLTFYALSKTKKLLHKLNLLLILTLTFSLLIYKDPNFAEYYLYPVLLPLFLILLQVLKTIIDKKSSQDNTLIFTSILTLLFFLNQASYNFNKTPFSLKNKKTLAKEVIAQAPDSSLKLYLPPGRKSGIEYLLQQNGYSKNSSAEKVAIISEATEKPGLKDHKLASSKVIGGFRLTIFVVQ